MKQISFLEDEQSTTSSVKHHAKPRTLARARQEPMIPLPSQPSEALQALSQALPKNLYLGTSSWSSPGWKGIVYAEHYDDKTLSQRGLSAYSQHPLLNCVSIDRSFYAPVNQATFQQYADQVPDTFRFVVKAPSSLLSPTSYKKHVLNPDYLNPDQAEAIFFKPLLALGKKLGWALLQCPPLPESELKTPKRFYEGLSCLLERAQAYSLPVMVEVRDRALLTHELVEHLIDHQARLCLSLHPRLPGLPAQFRIQAALPPGPLFIRWNLNRQLSYMGAKERYAPFNQRLDPDEEAQEYLALHIRQHLQTQQDVWVLANNKAEGCSPLTLEALAQKLVAQHA
ncbi:MAG: DUF72 domain-containing protein [Pseudomonadota bacterium]